MSLRGEGIIQHVGVAGGPIDLMIRFVETDLFEAVITHNRYTLVDRSAESLLDVAVSRGIPALNAAPYGGGMLARGPEVYSRYEYRDAPKELLERAHVMQRACRDHSIPLAAAALQFSLRDPRVTSTIVGISRAERVRETLELAQLSIPEALWAELNSHAPPRE